MQNLLWIFFYGFQSNVWQWTRVWSVGNKPRGMLIRDSPLWLFFAKGILLQRRRFVFIGFWEDQFVLMIYLLIDSFVLFLFTGRGVIHKKPQNQFGIIVNMNKCSLLMIAVPLWNYWVTFTVLEGEEVLITQISKEIIRKSGSEREEELSFDLRVWGSQVGPEIHAAGCSVSRRCVPVVRGR